MKYTIRKINFTNRIEQFSAPVQAPDNRIQRRQYQKILRAAMAALPPRLKTAAELYYKENKTVYEIALLTQVHPSTVSRRLSAARKQMQHFAAGCQEL